MAHVRIRSSGGIANLKHRSSFDRVAKNLTCRSGLTIVSLGSRQIHLKISLNLDTLMRQCCPCAMQRVNRPDGRDGEAARLRGILYSLLAVEFIPQRFFKPCWHLISFHLKGIAIGDLCKPDMLMC